MILYRHSTTHMYYENGDNVLFIPINKFSLSLLTNGKLWIYGTNNEVNIEVNLSEILNKDNIPYSTVEDLLSSLYPLYKNIVDSEKLFPSKLIFYGWSEIRQQPTALDTPFIIQFEIEAYRDTNYIDIFQDGGFLFKKDMLISYNLSANVHRDGNVGETNSFARITNTNKLITNPIQWNQLGTSLNAFLSSSKDISPVTDTTSLNVLLDDVFRIEFYNAGGGNPSRTNNAYLQTVTPTLTHWNKAYSASIAIRTNHGYGL